MEPNIGLLEEDRQGSIQALNTLLLPDEYVLYTKTRNYHWNVTGPRFHDLHRFFEQQYRELSEIVDDVAERVRSLGGWAIGTLAEFSEHTRLDEEPGEYPDSEQMVLDLLEDHETVIRNLRGDIEKCQREYHDEGTANFLTDIMQRHEKMAWMLRAMIEGDSM